MKLYLFYQISSKQGSITPTLYAFTEKKEYKKEFEETRNMNYFYTKEKVIEKKEFLKFRDRFQLFRLDHYEFKTKVENGIPYKRKIQVIATEQEALHIYMSATDNVFSLLGELVNIPLALTFKKEYKEALKKIDYFKIGSWYGLPFSDSIYNNEYVDNVDELDIEIDEFALFMKAYGDLMKK